MPDRIRAGANPAETVALHRRLKAWAREVECGTSELVGDLAEIHAAAREVIQSIESLAAEPTPARVESGAALVQLSAWINDELVDHIGSLNSALSDVITRLYDEGGSSG